jgi:hypothetical protein
MSFANPYVRATLTATRKGLPDPVLLVDLWLDRLLESLADLAESLPAAQGPASGPAADPDEAYDIVALFGRLRRCAPEVVAATGRLPEWRRAAADVAGRLDDLLRGALLVPDPEGWLREAQALADDCDDDADEADLGEHAEQLLTDLDDADLVAWAAERQGLLPGALRDGLARCATWLHDSPDRFFPAGVFVQGLGQTVRADLPAVDLALAGTADKLVLLLDALEDVEGRLGLPVVSPAGEDDWAGFPEPGLALAAKTPAAEGLFRRRWRSPDGAAEALLVAGPDAPGADSVRVNFQAGEEVPAALVGRPAWLAGLRATIDPDGNADFPRAALLEARREGRALALEVGEQRQAWRLA